MKLALAVKLVPSEAQRATLLQTMERFNAACSWIAEVAHRERCTNKFALQKLVYRSAREQYGLSAQMAIRAIAKVVEASKRDKKILPRFRPHGALPYDQRVMSWKGAGQVSLLTLTGRQLIPCHFGEYQRARIGHVMGQADLVVRQNVFYLHCTVDVPPAPEGHYADYLGIDLGIVNLAVDSDGETFSGEAVEANRRRFTHRCRNLQRKGTKASRRKLRSLSGRQRRYQIDTDHVVSKHVVAKAQGTARGIALENLLGIHERTTARRRQRARHANWSFGRLRAFIQYKARRAGVPVILVDPCNTSRTCLECGCVDKASRRSQGEFRCVSCGFTAPADHNAARVIAARARAAVMQPKVSDAGDVPVAPGTSRLLSLAGGS